MAKMKGGILGEISGKLGNFVAVPYQGKTILRARPLKSKKLRSPLQLKAQNRFAVVSQFLSQVRQFIEAHFLPFLPSKKAFGLAMAYHLKHALHTLENTDRIDPAQALFAQGPLPTSTFTLEHSHTPVLHWRSTTSVTLAKAEDQLTLITYEEEQKKLTVLPELAQRQDSQLILSSDVVPQKEIHLWSVWVNRTAATHSASQYLGKLPPKGR